MLTKIIKISNDGRGMADAMRISEIMGRYMGLDDKNSFRLRLLTEEMLGMVRAITGDFSAEFWIEERNFDCKLHLTAVSELDYKKRRKLVSVSSQGKNKAATGIMAKIREILETGLYNVEEGFELQTEYGAGMFNYGTLGVTDTAMSDAIFSWSMQKYKSEVKSECSGNPIAAEAWDELEKSIIANIADEVEVGVGKNSIELTVQKKFNGGN